MNPKSLKIKAKRLDNSEWVEGFIYHNEHHNTYFVMKMCKTKKEMALFEVTPGSICKCLFVHNGKSIFDGDIYQDKNKWFELFSYSNTKNCVVTWTCSSYDRLNEKLLGEGIGLGNYFKNTGTFTNYITNIRNKETEKIK